MDPQEVKEMIVRELPGIIKEDADVRDLVVELAEGRFAGKQETESRFDRLLEELRRDREEQMRKWEETQAFVREQERKWEENQAAIREQMAKLRENDGKWEENRLIRQVRISWCERHRS